VSRRKGRDFHPDAPVGLIINPVAGTDLRRLTSTAAFMDNSMKVRLARSVIGGMAGMGIKSFAVMPDYLGIYRALIDSLSSSGISIFPLSMEAEGRAEDTKEAVRELKRLGSPLIVSFGGDGTVRLIAEESGSIPILPISTGTNNTIPYFTEGTAAGLAAGYFLRGMVEEETALVRLKKLVVEINGKEEGIGLVEVAMTDYPFKGAAMIDISRVRDAVVSIAEPGGIGITSVAGMIERLGFSSRSALRIKFGSSRKVRAVVFPGVVKEVGIESYELIPAGSRVELERGQFVEADGERLFHASEEDRVSILVSEDGPFLVDVPSILSTVSSRKLSLL